MRSLRVGALALAALLAGCATVVHPGGSANRAAWQAHREQLARIETWHLQGRIGVSTPRHGGSASLDWRERDTEMTLLLSGPFGIGAVRLQGTPQAMQVRDSKGRTWTTYAPEQALESSLGWPLPVASLRYWVLGMPAPDVSARLDIGSRGLIRRLVQQGWQVRYTAYQRSAGYYLPQGLVVTRGTTRIKLIVSAWTLGGTK